MLISVDTFSGAVFASAHTGEKTSDVIKHLNQAFSFMGIPKELKTDNGPAYRSREFSSFLQQWGVGRQEKSYQFFYQTKKVYTARIWCDRIAHVEMASTTEEKPLILPKGELVPLECWVAKQVNLTSNALAGLLADEEVTRQATLQNQAAIDYLLLLLHGHRCEEFEGLCCFNLSTKAEDVHKGIQSIRDMVNDIKKETSDWLSGMFGNWGISGWVGSILRSVLLVLFIIVLLLIMIGIIKRMLNRLISSTTHSPSVNQVAMPSVPEWEEGMELEEDSEEGRNPDEEEPQMGWPTQLEWFAESYPDSEYLPPQFRFSSS
ncbi:hypothetical protein DUI87_32221 [Hirundo rustica rustica]|uniref:Integrase catalytic domain-containing protein n=1 Tax=Hirundo rustica rustica TaxID=333673 RepID=A0A3M0IU87_HIRRU|nr:hypothetical protein DUI87_32221 [Hirundo rustica rustica]